MMRQWILRLARMPHLATGCLTAADPTPDLPRADQARAAVTRPTGPDRYGPSRAHSLGKEAFMQRRVPAHWRGCRGRCAVVIALVLTAALPAPALPAPPPKHGVRKAL